MIPCSYDTAGLMIVINKIQLGTYYQVFYDVVHFFHTLIHIRHKFINTLNCVNNTQNTLL